MNEAITQRQSEIRRLCERYGVVSLELFGSAAGKTFNPDTSDFDFMASFSNATPDSDYGRRFLEFSRALEVLLDRPVDVITPESISSTDFRTEIAASRQTVYAAKR